MKKGYLWQKHRNCTKRGELGVAQRNDEVQRLKLKNELKIIYPNKCNSFSIVYSVFVCRNLTPVNPLEYQNRAYWSPIYLRIQKRRKSPNGHLPPKNTTRQHCKGILQFVKCPFIPFLVKRRGFSSTAHNVIRGSRVGCGFRSIFPPCSNASRIY